MLFTNYSNNVEVFDHLHKDSASNNRTHSTAFILSVLVNFDLCNVQCYTDLINVDGFI